MTWFITLSVLGALAGVYQETTGCKNCMAMGKEEKAMFRAHSEACLPQSHVDPKLVDALLGGELTEDPALRRHVFCVLLKCKVISKDGKLRKSAVFGKISNRADLKKILERCSDQKGDTSEAWNPEDVAWNLFKCGYDKKAVLFNFMPNTEDGKRDFEMNTN